MKTIPLAGFLFLIDYLVLGQVSPQHYFQGFVEEIVGKRFGYHSPFPDVKISLLVRGQEDYVPIEWKTEYVPGNFKGKYVKFIWVFAMDVTSDPVDFDLFVNGNKWFSFRSSRTSEVGPRIIKGAHGAELNLNTTMLDKYEDKMGFAILKLPLDAINPDASFQRVRPNKKPSSFAFGF